MADLVGAHDVVAHQQIVDSVVERVVDLRLCLMVDLAQRRSPESLAVEQRLIARVATQEFHPVL
jgi:hypothetical protein